MMKQEDSGDRPPDTASVAPVAPARTPLWLAFAPIVFLLLWSAGYSAVKIGLQSVEPFLLLALRYVIVLAVLIPICFIIRPRLPATPAQWCHLMVVGLLIQGLYFGATNLAIQLGVSAALLGIILALQPILVALLAPRLTGEIVSGYAWLGLIFGIAGAIIAILAKSHVGDTTASGIVTTICAVLLITAGTLYEKRFGSHQHLVTANIIQCSIGLAVVLPAAAATESMQIQWNWPLVISLFYSAICNSLVATSLLFAMIRYGAAARASALMFLVPPTSAAIAWYVFGEDMPPAVWLGMILAGVGVTLVRRN